MAVIERQVFRQLNCCNIRQETIIEVLFQRSEDNFPVNMRWQKSHYNCKISEWWVCLQIKNDPQTWFYCTKWTWCMFLKCKTIIWLMIYGFLTKSWKFSIYAGGFLVIIIFGTSLSLAQISQIWITMFIWFSQRCDQNRWLASQIWLIYLIVMVDHIAT